MLLEEYLPSDQLLSAVIACLPSSLNAIGANVGFVEIESDKGHDSFLLDVPDFLETLKNFLDKSYLEK